MSYKISYACVTNIGKIRDENQDNFYINGEIASSENESCAGELTNEKNIVAVCDGMGGEANGKEAAKIVAEKVREADETIQNSEDFNLEEVAMNCIETANTAVCEMSHKTGAIGGSTVNIVYTNGSIVHAFNLGDSRTYLFRNGEFKPLSRDHTTVADLVRMGALTEEEARKHPRRNQLNQFVGVPAECFKLDPYDSKEVELCKNDIILICSDGLTEMCENAEITEVLASGNELKEMVRELCDKALEKGGKDNITIILLLVQFLIGLSKNSDIICGEVN